MTTIRENKDAVKNISTLVVCEINDWLESNRIFSWKAIPCGDQNDVIAIGLKRMDPTVPDTPPEKLITGARAMLASRFNLEMSAMDDLGVMLVKVLPYVPETIQDVLARVPENVKASPAFSFDSILCTYGKITPIRHGYVAGWPGWENNTYLMTRPVADIPDVKTPDGLTISNRDAAYFHVPRNGFHNETMVCGAMAYSDTSTKLVRRIMKDPLQVTEEDVYASCLPDVIVENLMSNLLQRRNECHDEAEMTA